MSPAGVNKILTFVIKSKTDSKGILALDSSHRDELEDHNQDSGCTE